MSKKKKSHVSGRKNREAIIEYIKDFIEQSGYAPSYRDIGASMGFSPSSVKFHLDILEQEGKLKRVPNIARTIKLEDE